ncbi:hypothetical protein NLJ89_g1947 [Agrocybe chaxingu]|uniref:Uncharacterized protein n=1 Tax=Agrocybe chaxingu TaxID=84603 RepID=A0A9W8MZ24_9AGAR|nr:hypothetical protein NLJ89_g1947 [Agrocybe chaxingu]
MNACRTFPDCLEIKDPAGNTVPECIPTKALQQRSTALSYSWQIYSNIPEPHLYAFAEAALSPVKYSLFQLLGSAFIQWLGHANSVAPSTSVKIGAFGGTMLILLYFALLLKPQATLHEPDESLDFHSVLPYLVVLLKEMAYSVLAAIIGSLACGLHEQIHFHVAAGCLGPVLFLAILFGSLAVTIGVAWSGGKCKYWFNRY